MPCPRPVECSLGHPPRSDPLHHHTHWSPLLLLLVPIRRPQCTGPNQSRCGEWRPPIKESLSFKDICKTKAPDKQRRRNQTHPLTCVNCSVVVKSRAMGLKKTGSVSSKVGRECVNNGFM